jgi:hypothetical protein
MAEEVQIRNSTAQAKVRSPVAVALLSFFTVFIYFFFWWYFINREMKDLGQAHGTDELGDSPGKSLLAVTLGALIIVPAIMSLVRGFQRMQAAGRLVGREGDTANGWIGVILYLVFSPLFVAYIQSDLNKTWERQAEVGGAIGEGAGPGTAIGDAPADTAPAQTDQPGGTGTTGTTGS